MQVVCGRLDAPLLVHGELEVRGTVAGTISVASTASFVLRGVCERDVVVEHGGRADIWGIVQGNLINRGGHVRVFGMIEGVLQRVSGDIYVHAGSLVSREFVT